MKHLIFFCLFLGFSHEAHSQAHLTKSEVFKGNGEALLPTENGLQLLSSSKGNLTVYELNSDLSVRFKKQIQLSQNYSFSRSFVQENTFYTISLDHDNEENDALYAYDPRTEEFSKLCTFPCIIAGEKYVKENTDGSVALIHYDDYNKNPNFAVTMLDPSAKKVLWQYHDDPPNSIKIAGREVDGWDHRFRDLSIRSLDAYSFTVDFDFSYWEENNPKKGHYTMFYAFSDGRIRELWSEAKEITEATETFESNPMPFLLEDGSLRIYSMLYSFVENSFSLIEKDTEGMILETYDIQKNTSTIRKMTSFSLRAFLSNVDTESTNKNFDVYFYARNSGSHSEEKAQSLSFTHDKNSVDNVLFIPDSRMLDLHPIIFLRNSKKSYRLNASLFESFGDIQLGNMTLDYVYNGAFKEIDDKKGMDFSQYWPKFTHFELNGQLYTMVTKYAGYGGKRNRVQLFQWKFDE